MRRYGFSSTAALTEFQARPSAYVAAATATLRSHPHLISIFGAADASLPRFISDVADLAMRKISCHLGTQTPTHFIEHHIDHTCGSPCGLWVMLPRACAACVDLLAAC